jgi:CheY-like chemotaxis protein
MPLLSSILLVDDDSTTNYLNKILLLRLGVTERLFIAENGREALGLLAQTHAALILLDTNMPVMGGIEFLEAYQQLPLSQRQAQVVVLLTTSVNPRDLA